MKLTYPFWTVFLTLALLICLFSTARAQNPQDWLLLETEVPGDGDPFWSGKPELASRAWTPASTFKIVIGWAALEEGLVKPTTLHRCADPYISQQPVDLTLKEAMYRSSNDYFAWLAQRLGQKKLERYLRWSHFLEKVPASDWLADGVVSAAHGGKMVITPGQLHRFTVYLSTGQLGSTPEKSKELLEVLEWPSSDPSTRLYGKTGTAGGIAWFTGFSQKKYGQNGLQFRQHVVTYIRLYDDKLEGWKAARSQAIEAFYHACGVELPAEVTSKR